MKQILLNFDKGGVLHTKVMDLDMSVTFSLLSFLYAFSLLFCSGLGIFFFL